MQEPLPESRRVVPTVLESLLDEFKRKRKEKEKKEHEEDKYELCTFLPNCLANFEQSHKSLRAVFNPRPEHDSHIGFNEGAYDNSCILVQSVFTTPCKSCITQ